MKVSKDGKYLMVDDESVFPLISEDIEWILRYGTEEEIIKQRFYIASIVAAYDNLIKVNQKRRNHILSNIKSFIKSNLS